MAIGLFLAALFGPGLASHVARSADPYRFNDDARQQIWPFLRYHDPALFRHDVAADYLLACYPLGYKAVYVPASHVVDPRTLSKVLPCVLLIVLCAAAGAAAAKLQGRWAAGATIAFCLASPVFLERMGGGLPRSFAFPLYALAVLALVAGRPLLLAAVVCLGAAFYPTVAVTCGLTLAGWLLLCGAGFPACTKASFVRAGKPTLQKSLTLLVVTAALSALLVLPVQRAARPFGPILRPTDATAYPEVGPGGRYDDEDRAVGLFSHANLRNYVRAPLAGLGGPWESQHGLFENPAKGACIALMAVLGLAGFALLCRDSLPARRLLLLAAAAVIANAVSIPLAPYFYLPSRYQLYPFAVLVAIIVPAGIAVLAGRLWGRAKPDRARMIAVAGVCGLFLVGFAAPKPASRRDRQAGTAWDLGPIPKAGLGRDRSEHRRTFDYLAALPPDVLIAGWPGDVDDIPYVTGRPVLVSRELHQAFHRGYADEMRRRATAAIEASLSPDPAALNRLRTEFGVTHFLANRRLYDPAARKPPTYFAPFDQQIARLQQARKDAGDAPPAPLKTKVQAAVLADGDWVLLDLSKLTDLSPPADTREAQP